MASAATASASRTGACPPSDVLRMRRSKAQALETGRQAVGEADRLSDLRLPLRVVPQLELPALAHQHDTLVESGITAQRGRDENASGRIDVDFVGVTDDQPLQAADAVVERRERHQSRLDRRPFNKRIDEQAPAMVGGDDQAPVAAGGQSVPVARRDGEPSLRVEDEFGDAAKDGPPLRACHRRRFRHVPVPAACHRPPSRYRSERSWTSPETLPTCRTTLAVSPTSTHFLPLRRTIRACRSRGQRFFASLTRTYAKNATNDFPWINSDLRRILKPTSHFR